MPDTLAQIIGPDLLVIVAAAIVAGLVRGFAGFGAALVIVPVLSIVYGPLWALPIASLTGLPAVFQLLPDALRYSERRFVGPIALTTFLAAPLGALVLVSVDPALIKIAIAVLVLAMTAMLQRGWRLEHPPSLPILLVTGAGAGLVQGTAGVGGPPVVAVSLSRPVGARQQRANVLGAVSAIALSTQLPLWYFGLYTREVLWVSAILIPVHSVATWLGARLFTDRGQSHYRNFAIALLLAIGLVTLVLAVRDYVLGGVA